MTVSTAHFLSTQKQHFLASTLCAIGILAYFHPGPTVFEDTAVKALPSAVE